MQVGFHSSKLVTKVRVEKRINEVINRLNRTKQELYPNLEAERETYDRGIRMARKSELQVNALVLSIICNWSLCCGLSSAVLSQDGTLSSQHLLSHKCRTKPSRDWESLLMGHVDAAWPHRI